MTEINEKPKRGFAAMDPARQREIASMGGRAIPPEKRSYSKNRELASQSGRNGGTKVKPENRSYSRDRELASRAGKKGAAAVLPENRSFSQNPELAAEAGRKGGSAPRRRLPDESA